MKQPQPYEWCSSVYDEELLHLFRRGARGVLVLKSECGKMFRSRAIVDAHTDPRPLCRLCEESEGA